MRTVGQQFCDAPDAGESASPVAIPAARILERGEGIGDLCEEIHADVDCGIFSQFGADLREGRDLFCGEAHIIPCFRRRFSEGRVFARKKCSHPARPAWRIFYIAAHRQDRRGGAK